ncbi:MAG: NHLP family bacteriocin export ABC transporter peptidase/permease/ATPase subunit [Pseudomonadota bacterium]
MPGTQQEQQQSQAQAQAQAQEQEQEQEQEQKKKSVKWTKPVKTPAILQMEAVECGAASLAMILAYHGRWVSLEQLRLDCGVTRDGSKAVNILKAARKYGLEADGYKMEPSDLAQMTFPVIVFWNFNHFVVVEGFSKDRVHLDDPATGPRRVSHEEFNLSFTGVVLTFSPTESFRKGGAPTSVLSIARRWLRNSGSTLAYLLVCGLFLVLPGLAVPIISKIFIDDILVKQMAGWVGPLLIGLAVTALLRAVLMGLQRHFLLRFEEKLAVSFAARLFWHVLRLPVQFFTQRYGGEIGARVALTNAIARFFAGNLANTLLNVLLVVFFSFLMLSYDLWLTLCGVAISLANLTFMYFVTERIKNRKLSLLQERSKLCGTAMSGLQIIESLKAGGNEDDFFAKYAAYLTKANNAEQRLGLAQHSLQVVPELLSVLNNALILVIGSLQVMNGNMTLGMLIAFQSLMASFLSPVRQLVQLGGTLQEMNGNVKRVEDIIMHPVDPFLERAEEDRQESWGKLKGTVEVRGLTFGYSRTDRPLIKDFNLSVEPGGRVAIVGFSGSGKSTVAKLLAGIYEPWSGEIRFDGHLRSEMSRALLANSVAVVDQNIAMFEGTIRDNLTLWDRTLPDKDVSASCRDASIHEVVMRKPGEYQYRIEEGGRNFSGGEKQRFEIARALAINPSILILDEATSALDPLTEKEVESHVKRRGCTTIVVAHRLSTIRDCDEILVMEKGEVVERGKHEELLELGGRYARLAHG